ncbi:heme ABC exporter ATP-binding protein CcmA [Pelagibacterium xiamenense]|uniref:heme ABC exporter ATP-binding protein CcmA n=1 Tax=Pelagibacterium xiamenense TaxID=2901140 RepID=UPI001E3A8CEF|nr:heme ABC exporter ATP-binding protein CcmA [Pelagibacterium xiamenense]MCD7058395.1 heme ABC exporter ATP-binding protein CcmA [Pelagibacterium xiamenense]
MSPTVPSPPLGLTVSDLAIARGGVDVVVGFSAQIGAGQALVLRGPNGSGKSTTLLTLGGHLAKKAGVIQWVGLDPELREAAQMHFLGHLSAVQKGLSVRENLLFWTRVNGGETGAVDDALEAAGLGGLASVSAAVLSAGQTRRLALARLIAAKKPVWLLDEPTGALDAEGSEWVNALIGAHLERGGMAIIATHLPLGIEADARTRTVALERLMH